MGKDFPALLVLASLLGTSAPAFSADACSNDTFSIDGTVVTVRICTAPAAAKPPATPKPGSALLVETFSTHDASFSQSTAVDFLPGAEISRTIDDVSLARLGIARMLHMTIAYKPGNAKLERALLIPGAVVLK